MEKGVTVSPSLGGRATEGLPSCLAPGHVLNDTFRLVHVVAEGGMGVVFLTTHERLPGLFAVKTLRPDLPHSEESGARLMQEARVLASLNHPNIVRVFDFNSTSTGTPYLVMEFLEGRNLNEIIYARPLHPWEVVEIVRQVAAGLSAAHAQDIIHRDLKPENVFIMPVAGQGDVIKLIDFGVSKVNAWGGIDTRSGIVGTPHYMAPEQAKGERERVNGRADQFALAVMTFEMLSGVRPFTHDNPVTVLYRIVNDPPPSLGGLVGWPTTAVERVLSRGMQKDPDDRYASVAAFSDAFEAAVRADVGGVSGGLEVVRKHDELIRASRQAQPHRAASFSQKMTPVLNEGSGRGDVTRLPRRKQERQAAAQESGTRTKRLSSVRWFRRRTSRVLVVAVAAAVGACFLRPRAGPWLAGWRAAPTAGAQSRPSQTRATGFNSTVAPPGTFHPRSSDSGSAQPAPP